MNRLTMTACGLALAAACCSTSAWADEANDSGEEIVVSQRKTAAGTKTDTPLIETPQPISIIDAETYRAQGAISVADAFRYVSGIQANTYGTDGRVDSNRIRGVTPLQFRDGMRDIFDTYTSIRADPYNFSRIEVVRGPASVLFGQSSIGGLFNLVSKAPEFATQGEAAVLYGSFDRKEAMADLTGPLTDTIAARIVGRVRDSDTQVNYIQDNRVMIAPSIRWRPTDSTDLTLLGLYQEDDGGSQSTFLPLIGTLFENPAAGPLSNRTFPGTPGWDRYNGRLLQGTAILEQRFGENIKLSLKARYIDSDIDYRTQYANPFGTTANPLKPLNPYVAGSGGRVIDRTGSLTLATMDVFNTDNNVQINFNTGDAIEHLVLVGVDYTWQEIRRRQQTIVGDTIDLYAPNYAAAPAAPALGAPRFPTSGQSLLGFYGQDQIRFWDRVSVVFGVRHDRATTSASAAADVKNNVTTFRAGIIGELAWGVSPFFSYTESFLPNLGLNQDNGPFGPQTGSQFEAGIKWAPDRYTLVNVTAFQIKDRGRLVGNPTPDLSKPNPNALVPLGEVKSKGIEVEATRILPKNFELRLNYSYTDAKDTNGLPIANLASHIASGWIDKTFQASEDHALRLGTGVRYVGESESYGAIWLGSAQAPNGLIITPAVTLVDALAEVTWDRWSFSVNANNLLNKKFYAACLARGDCFVGAERNVFGTLRYRF